MQSGGHRDRKWEAVGQKGGTKWEDVGLISIKQHFHLFKGLFILVTNRLGLFTPFGESRKNDTA